MLEVVPPPPPPPLALNASPFMVHRLLSVMLICAVPLLIAEVVMRSQAMKLVLFDPRNVPALPPINGDDHVGPEYPYTAKYTYSSASAVENVPDAGVKPEVDSVPVISVSSATAEEMIISTTCPRLYDALELLNVIVMTFDAFAVEERQ
jgi:hypothetical protein